MKPTIFPFRWRHFEPALILLCVRWYCRYQLSYRDLEEMMRERGLSVDHTTIFRWVQRYAPEINKRTRPHLKLAGASYRIDETYIKVGKSCNYLYRAIDSMGNTIEFMRSAKRDVSAAKRFFKKMMRRNRSNRSFDTAKRTIQGIEAINMMKKGQIKRLDRSDVIGQAKFVASLFLTAA